MGKKENLIKREGTGGGGRKGGRKLEKKEREGERKREKKGEKRERGREGITCIEFGGNTLGDDDF